MPRNESNKNYDEISLKKIKKNMTRHRIPIKRSADRRLKREHSNDNACFLDSIPSALVFVSDFYSSVRG